MRNFVLHDGHSQLASAGARTIEDPGATPTTSAKGASDEIVWSLRAGTERIRLQILHAYAAEKVAQSSTAVTQIVRVITVANGPLYGGASQELYVYRLLPARAPHLGLRALLANFSACS